MEPFAIRHHAALTVTSLLSVFFSMVHLADDYSRGFSPAGLNNLPVFPVLALWVYATLARGERRWGHAVILVLSLLASGIPVLHMMGKAGLIGNAAPKSAGAFFFAWTLLLGGVTALCSVALSVQELWRLRRSAGVSQ